MLRWDNLSIDHKYDIIRTDIVTGDGYMLLYLLHSILNLNIHYIYVLWLRLEEKRAEQNPQTNHQELVFSCLFTLDDKSI